MKPNYHSRKHGFERRKRWSDNALAKKARLRIERANAADQKIIEEYESALDGGKGGLTYL
jgi:hypothetical protein